MNTADSKPAYHLADDEKVQTVMIYTATSVFWGDVIVKEIIRVSTWLRTNNCPDHICLQNAKAMVASGAAPKPIAFPALYIAVQQVCAYHLIPPARDQLDYDTGELNRKMEPVTALVGSFRLDGTIRIANISSLAHYLDVNRESFTALYDVDITNPTMPVFGVVKAPFVLVRQCMAQFATRS